MAGRADAHQRFAGFEVFANDRHLLGRGRAAADAQDQQVGVVQRLDPLEVVRRLGVGDHERAAHAQRLQLLGVAKAGRVFSVLYSSSPIKKTARGRSSGWNLKRGLARQVGRGDRRADVFLDVLDDPVGPLEVADVGPAPRVVHRVGQVAHQDHVLAVTGPSCRSPNGRPSTHILV